MLVTATVGWTSQRCEWLIVTSRNVSSKINVKPSKVQIPISFLIIWIFWSNKNEFTLHIMTCIKITESQNGQIYPEDTFSHGVAHIFFREKKIIEKCVPNLPKMFQPVTQNTLIFFIWPCSLIIFVETVWQKYFQQCAYLMKCHFDENAFRWIGLLDKVS